MKNEKPTAYFHDDMDNVTNGPLPEINPKTGQVDLKYNQLNGENLQAAAREVRYNEKGKENVVVESPFGEHIAKTFKNMEIKVPDTSSGKLYSYSSALEISFIELAIINNYLHSLCTNERKDEKLDIKHFGQINRNLTMQFDTDFEDRYEYFYTGNIINDLGVELPIIVQTKSFVDGNGYTVNRIDVSKLDVDNDRWSGRDIVKYIKQQAFFFSKYSGKCIKVKLIQGQFKGIEIIDVESQSNELILTKTQRTFLEHFVNRLKRGKTIRALLNGVPGTGKTETIREVARRLVPNATFIIPEFQSTSDLAAILEACEIFKSGVIIMDDIDLFLGSRENGSYTALLGEFLSFFDGVKKRTISVLASTNDKGLVDKAAERPGRFNLTLDYGYLDKEQIQKVCTIHLPERFNVPEVYTTLSNNINGKKPQITGAFISNLAENLIEMSEDEENWSIEDTKTLIIESYKGFYSSQVSNNNESIGFVKN